MSVQTQEQTSNAPIQIDIVPEQEVDNWDYAIQFSRNVHGTGQKPALPATIKFPSLFGYAFLGAGALFLIGSLVAFQFSGIDSLFLQAVAYSLLCVMFSARLLLRSAVFENERIKVKRGFRSQNYGYEDITDISWHFTGDTHARPVVKGVVLHFRDSSTLNATFSSELSPLVAYAMEHAATAGVDTSTWLLPTVKAAVVHKESSAPPPAAAAQ
jgi:hypothetical protein